MQPKVYNQHDAENMNMLVRYRNEPELLSDVCLFSSYSFSGVVEEYVYFYLHELQAAGFSIVFISTSPLQEPCISRLSQYAFMIIQRENKCPDFGSWKAGLSLLDWGRKLNAVLLVNDSVFGPLFNIVDIISSMKEKYDVWGMTESYEIDYHLQSYFLYFNKAATNSGIFGHFWKQVDLSASKDEVIHRYEVGLSGLFRNNNFSIGAYASIDRLTEHSLPMHKIVNPTLVFWKVLITKYKFPFFKRELLIKMNISRTYRLISLYVTVGRWRQTIDQYTDYPVRYIQEFIDNYYNFLQTGPDKNITLQKRKILFLLHSIENNEAQQLLVSFLQWLKTETDIGIEIMVCNHAVNGLENQFASLGVVTKFYSLSNAGKKNVKERLVDEIALIFSNTIENIPVQKFFSFLDVPRIVFVHEPATVLKDFFSAGDDSWLKKNISHFIASTDTSRQQLISGLDIAKEKTLLVNKFVNLYQPQVFEKKQHQIRSMFGIPTDAFVVGMYDGPGCKTPADLLPLIATALCTNNNSIHIIWLNLTAGTIGETIYPDLLKAGLTERVHLVKTVTDSRPYITAFDICIMIAREDSFPLINLECGLAGKPIICFGDPGAEYADFGITDKVPYLDIAALSEKVFTWYQQRTRLAAEKERLHGVVKTHFTTEVQAPAILELIRNYYDEQELMFKEDPPVTFIIHIYYENSWDEIRNKLKNFDTGKNYFLFSISEACLVKDDIIADIRQSFKNAYCLVTSNVGKDIGGKMALIDIYLLLNIKSEYIVFLHDKQSPHSIIGESWKNGLFKIVDSNNHRVILSLFKDPGIGIIGDKDHIVNEYNAGTDKFRNNSQLSKRLLLQFDMSIENYDFLGGSMYWIRSSIIKKFFEKNHPVLMRENLEAGNVLDLHEERLAHTWERMFSWIATNEGYTLKGI